MPAFRHALSLVVVVLLLYSSTIRADEPTESELEFFEKKVRPVLVQECYSCHSTQAKSLKGGLLLDTREGIRRGGDSGHGVVPGNLKESLIIEAIRHEGLEMPPKKQLSEIQIANLEKWVTMGAPDPREGKSAPIRQHIDFEKAREFWAFQPISNPTVPQPMKSEWAKTDIDRFVLAKLESKKLTSSVDAEPRVLIRRLYFDLIGLPPTPQQIKEFVDDPTETNLEAIVDRLLSEPQFGERWGRHWLDVVRYAESTGMERNYTYPHAWRYRDYVIASFNADKPFDRFITEQVAGDQIEFENKQQRESNLIATGLLALGPKSLNERDKEKFAMDIVDEQIDVVSRAFLGLTASCARCHDHKFDPIPQAEYYQLAGIFRSTNTLYGTGGGAGNRQNGQLLAIRGTDAVTVKVGSDKPKDTKKLITQLARQKKKLKALTGRKGVDKQIKQARESIARVEKQIAAADAANAKPRGENDMLVMAVVDSDNPADTQFRIRGEANERGETVPRGYLTIATIANAPKLSSENSGRAELAQWLTQKENPLTARVTANRIWQHLFGQGIVRTVNNFGANGDRPSHPELLDHLAMQLVENNWSIKSMIRSIVTSRTYRQTSDPNANAMGADPENRFVWRMNPRRLEAEAIRDAILATSGALDLEPGEKSVVSKVGNGDIGRNLKTDQFSTNDHKRSVYLPIVRGVVPEMLQIFDFPEPSIIAGSRDVTTVPTQALYMMNSPFVVAQSQQMAIRLLTERNDDAQRINYAYVLTMGRPASKDEIRRSLAFLSEAGSSDAGKNVAGKTTGKNSKPQDPMENAWAGFCQVLLASAEFRYVE